MTLQNLIIIYFVTLTLAALNVALLILKKYKLINTVGIAIAVLSGASIIITRIVSGHLPVYEKFVTLQNVVFYISVLGVIFNRTPNVRSKNINSVWYFVFILLLYILTQKYAINSNYYMYNKYYVIIFFQFRITAIAMFLFAMANYASVLFTDTDIEYSKTIMHRARNFILLGAIFYLLGEFSGSYWCFLWWGDPWHWSKGFFLASAMFLLSMISSHIPAKYINTTRKKAIYSLLPSLVIFVIYLVSH